MFPTLALLLLVDLRIGVHGRTEVVSALLVGFTALALASLPMWWTRGQALTGSGRAALAAFATLCGYALASSLLTTLPHLQKVTVSRNYLVVPVLLAVVTAMSAWGLVLAVEPAKRLSWLWWGAALVVVGSLLGWPRAALAQGSMRLSTGSMGGAATFHVALLLCAAVFAGAALDGHRRRASWVLATLSVVALLLTGSRAGLLCLLWAGTMLVVWAANRGLGRIVWAVVAGGGALFVALLALVPALRRMLDMSDQLRQTNLETAWRVWSAHPQTMLLGAGSGRLWPWYAFETGRLKIGWRGEVITEFGRAQTNPHSTFIGVGVELGLVGLLALLALCAVLVARLAREWRHPGDPIAFLVSVALVATLAANLFDYYLLKNFGVSWWWWVVLAAVLGTSRSGPGQPGEPVAATSAHLESSPPARAPR